MSYCAQYSCTQEKKYIRGNNKTFMTKAFSKAIMQGRRFRIKVLKNLTVENKLILTKKETKKENTLQD